MKDGTNLFLIIFTLFWSVGVLGFDAIAARDIYRGLHSVGFLPTTGRVTFSKVETKSESHGLSSYRPEIHFSYSANGQQLESAHYGSSEIWTSDFESAEKIVAENPVNKTMTVYYDPANPIRAYLRTGVDGTELFIVYFLMPFNCLVLGLWVPPISWLLRRFASNEQAQFGWIDGASHRRVRLGKYTPFLCALAGCGGTAFLGMFIVAFGFGASLSPPAMTWACGISVGAGVASAIAASRIAASGRWDLVVDDVGGRVQLPCSYWRRDPLWISRNEIANVEINQLITQWYEAPDITARLVLKTGRIEQIVRFANYKRAEEFVEWLRRALRLTTDVSPAPSRVG